MVTNSRDNHSHVNWPVTGHCQFEGRKLPVSPLGDNTIGDRKTGADSPWKWDTFGARDFSLTDVPAACLVPAKRNS